MTTAFVLSGGGSLGAVQVGMLQALADSGASPDLLIGTSAGALNAAWVATHGMTTDSLTELASVWIRRRRADIFAVDPRLFARGLVGHRAAVASTRHLEHLVSAHLPVDSFEGTSVPMHALAADLLSGASALISSGSLLEGILASTAIPGIFPPVERDGQFLVDGGVGPEAGVAQAVGLRATRIYVLPTGTPCALDRPPGSAVGVALHALALLSQHRLQHEVADFSDATDIRLLPPLCPLAISAADFSHGAELIHRARRTALAWIADGGLQRRNPARFLSGHRHRTDNPEEPRIAQALQRNSRRSAVEAGPLAP